MTTTASTNAMNNRHMNYYKSPISMTEIRKMTSATATDQLSEPLSWRSAYKKRCIEETKKSRQKLLCKFRNLQVLLQEPQHTSEIGNFLEDELKKICLSEARDLVSIDEAIEIYNQIRSEMIEFMKSGNGGGGGDSLFESDAMREQWLVETSDQEKLFEETTTRIVCPLCQKANLDMKRGSTIECENAKCQFKIDAFKSGIRNLDELFVRLQSSSQQHPCSEAPKFLFQFLNDESDNKNSLVIYCETCGFMQNIF